MFRSRGNQRSHLGVIMLLLEVYRLGQNYIPPVTFAITIASIVMYFAQHLNIFAAVGYNLPDTLALAFNAHAIVTLFQVKRIFIAPFLHSHDFHLYYNMSSLLMKGRSLELAIGSGRFLAMVLINIVTCGLIHVLLAYALFFIDIWPEEIYVPSIGFSSVLFALKTILNKYSEAQYAHVMGISINIKWASWVEILLIQMIIPNASFLGHVSGILAGMLYVQPFSHDVVTKIEEFGIVVFDLVDDNFLDPDGEGRRNRPRPEDLQQDPPPMGMGMGGMGMGMGMGMGGFNLFGVPRRRIVHRYY